MSKELIEMVTKLFQFLDKDGDGQINWSEFVEFQISSQKVLKANWPVDIASIRKEFSEMDEDANGKISKNEFIQAFENIHKRTPSGVESVCHIIRKVIVLHPNEINTSRKEIFVAGMLRTFDEADKDGDGNMDFVEFLRQQWEGRPELTYRDSNLRQMRREFRKLDLNRDGKISRQEFITMAENCFDKNN